MRTSFVIGRDRGAGGGALKTLGLIARLGLGGRVGKGTQGHVVDSRARSQYVICCRDHERLHVRYLHRIFPESSRSSRIHADAAKGYRMPIGVPALEWMVRIGAPLFLRTDPDLHFTGATSSKRLREAGFFFQFPALEAALKELYRR